MSTNRGFHDTELFDEEYDEVYMRTRHGLDTEEIRQLTRFLPRKFNTLTTKFPHKGVMCQVLIDGGIVLIPGIGI